MGKSTSKVVPTVVYLVATTATFSALVTTEELQINVRRTRVVKHRPIPQQQSLDLGNYFGSSMLSHMHLSDDVKLFGRVCGSDVAESEHIVYDR